MSGDRSTGRGERVEAAFAAEEADAQRMATRVRSVALAVIAVWITIENGFPDVLYYYPFIAGLAAIGYLPLWLRHRGRFAPWQRYLFPLLDCAMITVAVLVQNPLDDFNHPAPFSLRDGNETYLFVILAGAVFSYSPRVVWWAGVSAATVWAIGALWIAMLPGSIIDVDHDQWTAMSSAEKIVVAMDPNRVWLGDLGRQILLLLVLGAILATMARRTRLLVARQAETEYARANLSRYFSANVVDELATSDAALRTPQERDVAVLFVDLVGFTELSERMGPQSVLELLKAFQARVERAVFAAGGTLDKYIGDAVMVTFGTPRSAGDDAGRALECAREILRELAEENLDREARGEPPLEVGMGLHFGPVVAGDVGRDRLEYTVIGDTVNVASRLERLTRELGATLLVSEAVIEQARSEGVSALQLADLEPLEPVEVRGRAGALGVRMLAKK